MNMSFEIITALFRWKIREKILIRQELGENTLLNRSKEEKTSLNLLSMSMIGPLIFKYWLLVSIFNNNQWGVLETNNLDSRSDLKMWLWGREWALSCHLLLSFWRCKQIGIRPAIVSIPNTGKVWKAPMIQIVALFYILLSSLRGYDRGALL